MSVQTALTVGGFQLSSAMQSTMLLAEQLGAVRKAVAEPKPEEMTQADALALQSSVASTLLATDGYKILEEMYVSMAQMVEATMLFVLPVMMEEETIRTTLGESFEAFNSGFQALREDLATVGDLLQQTYAKHRGRSGEITEADLEMITNCSLAYSKLQTQLEEHISPELMNQMTQLESAGISADVLHAALAKALQESEEATDV